MLRAGEPVGSDASQLSLALSPRAASHYTRLTSTQSHTLPSAFTLCLTLRISPSAYSCSISNEVVASRTGPQIHQEPRPAPYQAMASRPGVRGGARFAQFKLVLLGMRLPPRSLEAYH